MDELRLREYPIGAAPTADPWYEEATPIIGALY